MRTLVAAGIGVGVLAGAAVAVTLHVSRSRAAEVLAELEADKTKILTHDFLDRRLTADVVRAVEAARSIEELTIAYEGIMDRLMAGDELSATDEQKNAFVQATRIVPIGAHTFRVEFDGARALDAVRAGFGNRTRLDAVIAPVRDEETPGRPLPAELADDVLCTRRLSSVRLAVSVQLPSRDAITRFMFLPLDELAVERGFCGPTDRDVRPR